MCPTGRIVETADNLFVLALKVNQCNWQAIVKINCLEETLHFPLNVTPLAAYRNNNGKFSNIGNYSLTLLPIEFNTEPVVITVYRKKIAELAHEVMLAI